MHVVTAGWRFATTVALVGGALTAGTPALAQGACARADLQKAADGYLAAQTTGEATKIPLAGWVEYTEQFELGSLFSGVMAKPQKIAFSRTLLDEQACQTFSEVIITDPAHPYVIGTRLQYTGESPIGPHSVSAIESVVTDKDDPAFDAAKSLADAKAAAWTPIAAGSRDTRDALRKAADAYLTAAPGGSYGERRYVIDESLGAVAILSERGAGKAADMRVLRIEGGQVRSAQAISACKGSDCAKP